jgi:hypothetical protein
MSLDSSLLFEKTAYTTRPALLRDVPAVPKTELAMQVVSWHQCGEVTCNGQFNSEKERSITRTVKKEKKDLWSDEDFHRIEMKQISCLSRGRV